LALERDLDLDRVLARDRRIHVDTALACHGRQGIRRTRVGGRPADGPCSNVEVRDARVDAVTGTKGSFRVAIGTDIAEARRLLLCTGMIDEMLAIDGFSELWGHGIFQCPYCHGWEAQDRAWGYLASAADLSHFLPFALQLRGWTGDVVVFTSGTFEVPDEARVRLQAAGVRLETAPLVRLVVREKRLAAVALSDGTQAKCSSRIPLSGRSSWFGRSVSRWMSRALCRSTR
jgi:thioredoxin reductase